MTEELQITISMAALLAVLHTITGPDHYVPFVMLSKSRNWSVFKTTWLTFICGLGHVTSSVVLSSLGILLGFGIKNIEGFNEIRGHISALMLILFGLIYMIWGIYKAKNYHGHYHHSFLPTFFHRFQHNDESENEPDHKKTRNLSPWFLFIVFILGPCEPLIAYLIYPAANLSYQQILTVIFVFGMVTIITMLSTVLALSFGLQLTKFGKLEKYTHAFAGGSVLLSGFAIILLG